MMHMAWKTVSAVPGTEKGWFRRFLFRSRSRPGINQLQGFPDRRGAIARAVDPDGGKSRTRLLWSIQLAMAGIILVRLGWVQVIRHSYYAKVARSQHITVYKMPVTRGVICDRNGHPLVISQEAGDVYMIPQFFLRKRERAWPKMRALCNLLGVPAGETWARASRDKFIWLKKRASPAEIARVRKLCQEMKIAGVGYEPLCLRHYPEGRMACQVLGCANDRGSGLEGLEFSYDKYLKRTPGDLPVLRDNLGNFIFSNGGPLEESTTSAALTLTIDANIQRVAERELEAGLARVGARWGCAIVMETETGELLAMANAPRFHPVRFAEVPAQWRANRAVNTTFEPGSTFKLVALAAGLQDNIVKPDTVFDCEMGAFMLGEEVIHDTEAHGGLSVSEMLAQSSNIGFAKLGMKLGHDRMYSWAQRFGFGEATKVGLPGEERGILNKTRDSFSLSAIAFGQGVGVTAIQVAAAYGAIANGGVLMRPYIVRESRDARGSVRMSNHPKPVRRVVSGRVARTIIEMLEGVVSHGTGRAGAINGYRVCGKTGTAQVSDSKGYLPDEAKLVTFVGFLPAEAPRILVLVAMDRPKYGSGGGVAGPVFREIALAAIRQAGIPPTSPDAVAFASGGGR